MAGKYFKAGCLQNDLTFVDIFLLQLLLWSGLHMNPIKAVDSWRRASANSNYIYGL
jgi:hypothetical protein